MLMETTTIVDQTTSWAQLISTLGFPIVVCLWFMWRDYKFLNNLTMTLTHLNDLIEAVLKIRDGK